MANTKKDFKYSLRQCRKDVELHKTNGLAAALQADKNQEVILAKGQQQKQIPITTNIGRRGKWWLRDC